MKFDIEQHNLPVQTIFHELSCRVFGADFNAEDCTRANLLGTQYSFALLERFIEDYIVNMHDVEYVVEFMALSVSHPRIATALASVMQRIQANSFGWRPHMDDDLEYMTDQWYVLMTEKFEMINRLYSNLMQMTTWTPTSFRERGVVTISFRHVYGARVDRRRVSPAEGFLKLDHNFNWSILTRK